MENGRRGREWCRKVVTRGKEIEKADERMPGASSLRFAKHSFVWMTLVGTI